MSKVTKNEEQRILNMLAHGHTTYEIMEATGRSRETIHKISSKHNMHDRRFNKAGESWNAISATNKAADTIYAILMGLA